MILTKFPSFDQRFSLWDKTRSFWDIESSTSPPAREWVRERAKEQTNERSEARQRSRWVSGTNKWMSEWPSTDVPILGCSEPLCNCPRYLSPYHPLPTPLGLAPISILVHKIHWNPAPYYFLLYFFFLYSFFPPLHGIPEVGMSWKKPLAFITYVTRYKKRFPTRIYNFLKNPLVSY